MSFLAFFGTIRTEIIRISRAVRKYGAGLLKIRIPHYTLGGAVWQASMVTACWAGWKLIPAYTFHAVYTGYAIAVLGVMAVVMAARAGRLTKLENALWIALAATLFFVEIHIIDDDHRAQDKQHSADLKIETDSFAAALDRITKNSIDSSGQFNATMKRFAEDEKLRQQEFAATVKTLSDNEGASQARFGRLIDHEEKLSEGQTGVLVPSNEATPVTPCPTMHAGKMIAIVEQGGDAGEKGFFSFDSLPHVIVGSKSHGPILSIDRAQNGSLSVILDLRSEDGKIIVRIAKDGYVINRSNTLNIQKSDHSLSVIDLYGTSVLSLKYLNPTTLIVRGPNLGMAPFVKSICGTNDTTDIFWNN